MKKIISLIASLAMVATMASSVFAAAVENNAPVVESTVTEVSAADFNSMMGMPLEEGQKAYMIAVNAKGFDLESKPGTGFGGNAKRTGVLLSTVEYKLVFEDPSKFVMAAGMDDGIAPAGTVGLIAAKMWDTAPAMYPVIANTDTAGKTVIATDNLYINTFMLVVAGEVNAKISGEFTVVPVTNNTLGASQVFRNDNNNISYTVNGEAATSITFGATATPDPEPPVTPEEPKDIVISAPMALVAGEAKGIAWDVTINNFDSASKYVATFTDDADTKRDEGQVIKFEVAAETDGSIGFATILNLSQARNVSLNIEKK